MGELKFGVCGPLEHVFLCGVNLHFLEKGITQMIFK